MNDTNLTSLRPETARASSVSVRPEVKKEKTDQSGNTLPQGDSLNAEKLRPQQEKISELRAKDDEQSKRVKVEAAIEKMNEFTQATQRDIQFNLDEELGRTIVTVVDRDTQEVVRQIPDETFLKMARKLNEELNSGNEASIQLLNVNV